MSLATTSLVLSEDRQRTEIIDELRRLLPRMESIPAGTSVLPLGIPALDSHLPQGGLVLGALHEILPESHGHQPAAFGFAAALAGRAPRAGPVLIVTIRREFPGRPYGHGLSLLGLDPKRVILIEAAERKQALWAVEEALHSNVPAAVVGTIERLDLRTSQRLQIAAKESGIPLLLLRPAGMAEPTVAMTRWRVISAAAARDRFGLTVGWRWHLSLERCRNGRTGEWLVEFDHAYRFSLASAMADPALSRRAGREAILRAG